MDPDNRRPVDYGLRQQLLEELQAAERQDRRGLVRSLWPSWQDGRIKLYVTYKALQVRAALRNVFEEGAYTALAATQQPERVVAFARHDRAAWALVAVPRLTSKLVRPNSAPVGRRVWRDDALALPQDAPQRWRNAFTGEICHTDAGGGLPLAQALRSFPIALLTSEAEP